MGSYANDLALGLLGAGHHVTVLVVRSTPCRPEQARMTESNPAPGLRVYRANFGAPICLRWRGGVLWHRWQIRRWVLRQHRRTPFDLVKAPEGGGLFPFGLPKSLPLVMTLQGTSYFYHVELGESLEQPFETWLERSTMERAHTLIANSEYTARRLPEVYGVRPKRLAVIYNCVDTQHFKPDAAVPIERGLIVFVNSIEPRKGVAELVAAMKQVLAAHPHARLVLVGRDVKFDSSGRAWSESIRRGIPADIADRIEFAGPLDRNAGVLDLLRRAEVCCYPSYLETFGIAPVEAMSVGKPVVYSRTGTGPELIEDGVSGLLCDPRDPADIARCLATLLANPALGVELGAAARQRALRLFDRGDWISRHEAVYRRAVEAAAGLS